MVPLYLEDPSVRDQTNKLITAAADKNRIPTAKELKEFGNLCLVQLMIKNCHRKEIFQKLTREEYVTARGDGLKVVQYVPHDDGGGHDDQQPDQAGQPDGDCR